jgi:hypothetical protein
MVNMETDACATRAASASAGTQPLTGTVPTSSATDILLFNRDIAFAKTTFPSSLRPHTPSPPFSAPSSSSKSSESHTHTHTLSRTSSVSSLISSCSATTSTSATSDDDEDDDSSSGVYLISILKTPRQPRGKQRNQQQRQQHRNRSNQHTSHDSDSDGDGDGDDDHETEVEVEVEEEDDDDDEVDWEDEDSECDIIFERNVTFDDPLATDVITGAPVPPSTRSRVEWTAMRARACLEREKTKLEMAWAGLQEDDEEDAQDAQEQGTEKRAMSMFKTLNDESQDVETFEIESVEWQEEGDEDLSEWLSRATLRDNSKPTPECSDRGEMEGWAAEVGDLALDITETVVGAAS